MPTQREILDAWQTRLAESQFALDHGREQLRWLRRMYVRLYSFLIRVYGGGWRAAGHGERAVMPLVDNTADLAGRPPRSPASLRAALEQLHAANDVRIDSGPLRDGLQQDDWIPIAAAGSRLSPKRCRQLFEAHAIPARLIRCRGKRTVVVPAASVDAALNLIERHPEAVRAPIPAQRAAARVALMMDVFCGALFGQLLVVSALAVRAWLPLGPDPFDSPQLVLLWMGVGTVLGGLAGSAAGQLVHRKSTDSP